MLLVVFSLTIGAVVLLLCGQPGRLLAGTRPSIVAARSLDMPAGLHSRQVAPKRFVLAWQPVPGATSYLARVGIIPLYGDVTRWQLLDVQPGASYRWTVRAQFGDRLGPVSSTATFRVPPMRTTASTRAADRASTHRRRAQSISRQPALPKIRSTPAPGAVDRQVVLQPAAPEPTQPAVEHSLPIATPTATACSNGASCP